MKTFSKAQLAALLATVVDFGTLTVLAAILPLYYPIAVAIGALGGAITNFTVNRHWSFHAGHRPVGRQAVRYAMVSGGSLLLNTFGVYLVTEHFKIHFLYSKAFIAIAVGVFYNYPLHKFFVYSEDAHHGTKPNPA